MNSVTDTLIRRAASQALQLARQNCRAMYTEPTHRVAEANVLTKVSTMVQDEPQKTFHDLHGANAYPVIGTVSEPTRRVAEANVLTKVSTRVQEEPQKTIHDLPGPNGYPVIGTASEYFRKQNRGQMHEVQRRFHAQYGRIFKERLGPVTNVSIADPNLVEELLRHEGKYPFRPPYDAWMLFKKMKKRSNGIVSAQGEEWRRIRSVLNGKLMKPKHAQKYLNKLSTISEDLTDKIQVVRDQNDKTVPDVLNLLYAWSIECLGHVLIDKHFGCLLHDMPPRMNEFVKAIEKMMLTSHRLMVFSNIHKRLNTKDWRTHVAAWDKIIEVAEGIIDDKIEEIGKCLDNESSDMSDGSFLEYLLGNKSLSEEEIYTNLTELLLSGVDATSNTVAVALNLLAQNPMVQDKVRKEVDSIEKSEPFSLDDVKSMTYIKAFTKEVLRCYPTVPTNARVMTEDTKIAGYVIPKKTIVLFNTFTMCRDPKYFSNPDDFIPERWLRNEAREFSPFTALPFGFGTRSCVGRRIAENMIYLSVANITKRYRLEPVEGAASVKPFVRTVLTLGENLPVQFIDR